MPEQSHPIPFTDSERTTLLEAARIALADADVFDYLASEMDIADDELKSLQQRLEVYMTSEVAAGFLEWQEGMGSV